MPPALEENPTPSPDVDGDLDMSGTDQGSPPSPIDGRDASTTTPDVGGDQASSVRDQASTSDSNAIDGVQDEAKQQAAPHGHLPPTQPSAPNSRSQQTGHHHQPQGHSQQLAADSAPAHGNLPKGPGISPGPQSFDSQCARLGQTFTKAQPEALRRVVRDYWHKSLIGSEYHMQFVVCMIMEHIPVSAREKLGQQLATAVTPVMGTEVAKTLTTKQIDQASRHLIQNASEQFMMSCLYQSLRSMGARQLVEALAHTKRLGFELTDTMENGEQIRPAIANVPTELPNSAPATGVYQCAPCGRKFVIKAAFLYHATKLKCHEPPNTPVVSRCAACGATFATAGGIGYHAGNNVCGGFGPDPGDPRPPPQQQSQQHQQPQHTHHPQQPQHPQQPRHPQQPQQSQPPQHHEPSQHPHGTPSRVPSSTPAPAQRTQSVASNNDRPLQWKQPTTQTPTPATKVAPPEFNMIRSDIEPPAQPRPAGPVPSSGFTPVPASKHNQHKPRSQHNTPAHKNVARRSNVTPQSTSRNESDELLKALAELTDEQRADYYDRMEKQEQSYEIKVRNARKDYAGEAQVTKLKSLKACFAAAQSSVRQKFGIKLRGRRPAAATLAENQRIGFDMTPAQERRATQEAAGPTSSQAVGGGQWQGQDVQNSTPSQPSGPQVAVSNMNGGLVGSSATAATEDPTIHASPSRIRSDFVAQNASPAQFRESLRQPAAPPKPLPPPIDVESSDDSDSDIPGA